MSPGYPLLELVSSRLPLKLAMFDFKPHSVSLNESQGVVVRPITQRYAEFKERTARFASQIMVVAF